MSLCLSFRHSSFPLILFTFLCFIIVLPFPSATRFCLSSLKFLFVLPLSILSCIPLFHFPFASSSATSLLYNSPLLLPSTPFLASPVYIFISPFFSPFSFVSNSFTSPLLYSSPTSPLSTIPPASHPQHPMPLPSPYSFRLSLSPISPLFLPSSTSLLLPPSTAFLLDSPLNSP